MKTFFDSCVLLTAHDARHKDAEAALALIERREFYTSEMVKLELLPKAVFFKQAKEVEFYETIFAAAAGCQPLNEALAANALSLAKETGMAAADALNLAAAITLGCDEFVTCELPGKAMYRARQIRVVTLHAAAN